MKQLNNINQKDLEILKKKYVDINPIIEKINNNYPVQYLIGNVDFYGNIINVNKNVLIPRFETETLVEKTINYINKLKLNKESLLEIGTGSGCISITLKKEVPTLEITAIDISKKALLTAKKNAKLNKTKINFIYKDLFKYNMINKYSILISNPPYIKLNDEIDAKTKYEPKIALYADETGLKYYKKIFEIGKKHLEKNFLISLEIEETQGKKLQALAKEYFSNCKIIIEKDLANKDRYLFIFNE